MTGSPDNDHPDSLWQADQTEVAGQVAEAIREFRPQVVITFDAFGGYGHPDHIAIHRATLQAFHETADVGKYPEQLAKGLEPYQAQKLYYVAFPRAVVRLGILIARLRRQDPRRMGRNNDIDMQAIIDATLPTHTRLDLRRYFDNWQQANACHISQLSPQQSFPMPKFITRWVYGYQSFFRAWPEVNGQAPLERDLFEGAP